MPKVTVYLPNDLYREAKARNLSLSALTQDAVERVLRDTERRGWVERIRSRPRRYHGTVDSAALLDEAREEFGQ